jgi:hypothetical protein
MHQMAGFQETLRRLAIFDEGLPGPEITITWRLPAGRVITLRAGDQRGGQVPSRPVHAGPGDEPRWLDHDLHGAGPARRRPWRTGCRCPAGGSPSSCGSTAPPATPPARPTPATDHAHELTACRAPGGITRRVIPEDRPTNAVASCGVGWMNWYPEGDRAGDPCLDQFIMRQQLTNPSFTQRVAAVATRSRSSMLWALLSHRRVHDQAAIERSQPCQSR